MGLTLYFKGYFVFLHDRTNVVKYRKWISPKNI